MRTYTWGEVNRDYVEDVSTEWVPADAARGLYDIVAVLVEHGAWYPSAIELDTFDGALGDELESDAIAALAAADGEESGQ